MKRLFRWWRHDVESLERAKRADEIADAHLREAKRTAAWARRTLEVNNLTERFYRGLHHGGNT